MIQTDLNLLHALDVLLSEGSVVKAAKRLQLSPSAMSRALSRLRTVTGDQLLVRAGRSLVPTPRADVLRDQVHQLVEEAVALLRPAEDLDPASLQRAFTIRTSDGFAETIGPALIDRVQREAPRVRIRFVRKLDKGSEGLRSGSVDLETGVIDGTLSPEVRSHSLFTDRYIGVVRLNHPLAHGRVTRNEYVEWNHVVAWREGIDLGKIDDLLAEAGLARTIAATVDGFAAALALARGSDLVATVPALHTNALRHDMAAFEVPLPLVDFKVALLWHPRFDSDPAHRWFRDAVRTTTQAISSKIYPGGVVNL